MSRKKNKPTKSVIPKKEQSSEQKRKKRSLLAFLEKEFHIFGHVLEKGIRSIIVSGIAIIALVWIIFSYGINWWTWTDPAINFLTLAVAILVWYNEVRQDWREKLEKRLSVEFKYKGKVVMKCENARLFGESDIRALGQQIGAQMAEDRHLNFAAAYIKSEPSTIEWSLEEREGKMKRVYFMKYYAQFILLDLPEKLKKMKNPIIWRYPFVDGDGKPTFTFLPQKESESIQDSNDI